MWNASKSFGVELNSNVDLAHDTDMHVRLGPYYNTNELARAKNEQRLSRSVSLATLREAGAHRKDLHCKTLGRSSRIPERTHSNGTNMAKCPHARPSTQVPSASVLASASTAPTPRDNSGSSDATYSQPPIYVTSSSWQLVGTLSTHTNNVQSHGLNVIGIESSNAFALLEDDASDPMDSS
ncbi:hypothetical protein IFM89_010796 [Coptis chinensis]|uniref:Uncharacterized protein n=1 Tax=Coptis chinensis TaxID=261450 RepID=A0A835M8C3_9MAGN|nr:hypothetical protein IFM89_010796 [Coptis chinensis]